MMSISSSNGKNKITINGKAINVEGSNITMQNGNVYVDGKLVEGGLSGEVTIKFEGDLANLKSDGSVAVHGNVNGDARAGGSLSCGDIGQDARAGGSLNCKTVNGDAKAGGSINMAHR